MRCIDEGGHVEDDVKEEEDFDGAIDPAAQAGLEFAFGFHHEIDGTVHGEEGDGGEAEEDGVGVEQRPESADVVAARVEFDTDQNVAHGHTDEKTRPDAAEGKTDVPHLPPPTPGFLAAEFNGHGAENKPAKQGHESEVEPGENRGISHGKSGEERAASGDQPHFIAVPNGSDGIEKNAAVFVLLDEEMQRADPEVEAVEHSVAGEEDADQDEPDSVEVHGAINRPSGPVLCGVP